MSSTNDPDWTGAPGTRRGTCGEQWPTHRYKARRRRRAPRQVKP